MLGEGLLKQFHRLVGSPQVAQDARQLDHGAAPAGLLEAEGEGAPVERFGVGLVAGLVAGRCRLEDGRGIRLLPLGDQAIDGVQ